MATEAERWKEVLRLEEWLDQAREDAAELDPASECEYETARAYHWVGYLEDLVEIKRRAFHD